MLRKLSVYYRSVIIVRDGVVIGEGYIEGWVFGVLVKFYLFLVLNFCFSGFYFIGSKLYVFYLFCCLYVVVYNK